MATVSPMALAHKAREADKEREADKVREAPYATRDTQRMQHKFRCHRTHAMHHRLHYYVYLHKCCSLTMLAVSSAFTSCCVESKTKIQARMKLMMLAREPRNHTASSHVVICMCEKQCVMQ